MAILDDIQDYLEDGHRYENYISCKCMFHDDSRPSLLIHEDFYGCLSCGKSGRTEHLLNHLKGLPVRPQVKPNFHNPFTKWIKKYDGLENILKIAYKTLKNNPDMGNYLIKKRGISQEIIRELKIGWVDGWFTFPVFDKKQKITGAFARAGESIETDAKYIIPSGQSPDLLYIPSWNLFENARQIYCTFGPLDAITLYMYKAASFSTLSGKRLNSTALDGIRKRIIFIPDKGEEKDAAKIAKELGWRGVVAKIIWDDSCKDVNDEHVQYPSRLQSTFNLGA